MSAILDDVAELAAVTPVRAHWAAVKPLTSPPKHAGARIGRAVEATDCETNSSETFGARTARLYSGRDVLDRRPVGLELSVSVLKLLPAGFAALPGTSRRVR